MLPIMRTQLPGRGGGTNTRVFGVGVRGQERQSPQPGHSPAWWLGLRVKQAQRASPILSHEVAPNGLAHNIEP